VPRRDDNLVSPWANLVYVPRSRYSLFSCLFQSESSARVVNTLLTELDGLDARKSVYVIAATNRPDMIDPAMVRPGRLDKLLYVDLPSAGERAEILRTLIRKVPLYNDAGVSVLQTKEAIEKLIADKCEGYSGADLAALVREAGVTALKRTLGALDAMEDDRVLNQQVLVELADFVRAMEKVVPSVSVSQRRKYHNLRSKFAGLPVGARREEDGRRVDDDKARSVDDAAA
jgi:ribosome biogenesis ATPase